jgi:hypothetical protein
MDKCSFYTFSMSHLVSRVMEMVECRWWSSTCHVFKKLPTKINTKIYYQQNNFGIQARNLQILCCWDVNLLWQNDTTEVWILVWKLAILINIFCAFPGLLLLISEITPYNRPQPLPSQFIIYSHSVIQLTKSNEIN